MEILTFVFIHFLVEKFLVQKSVKIKRKEKRSEGFVID